MVELEGRTLDRYELRQLIGRGGMANVYEAYDPSFHRVVAVKVFKREDDMMLRRFVREAQLMAGLHHPHLVQVYDTGECMLDGVMRYYIVMPMLTGGTLRVRIRRAPLSLSEACRCLNDIAGALDYIHHEGIIHRDIKASNVLLNDEGRCYLTDFGVARITTDATQLTSTGNVLGTADYVAPELFEVHRRADARSDLYSLGVLLYEMVTGRLPFSADNQLALISMHISKQPPEPHLYVPRLPAQVERVMMRAMEKQPEMRYGSATMLAEAFCRAVKESSVNTGPDQAEPTPVAVAVEPLAVAPVPVPSEPDVSVMHPSSVISGTRRFVLPPLPTIPTTAPAMPPETPLPLASAPTAPRSRQPRKPRSARALFLAILALVALAIVAVPIVYTVSHPAPIAPLPGTTPSGASTSIVQNPTGTPNMTQTAQSSANATATANAQATASAIAGATATANAHASATVGPISTATAGQPAYADPLNSASNQATANANWDQNNQCSFASDGYHVTQPASIPYFKGCREHNNTYSNLALSVDVTLLSGHTGGVFFRLGTNLLGNYDGYLYEIDSQGNYKISREQGATVTPIQDWSNSSLLHTGYQQVNFLQLLARGNTLQFYANGHYLTQVQNSYYSGPATIGFLATSLSGGSDAEVVYSNLKVYSLP